MTQIIHCEKSKGGPRVVLNSHHEMPLVGFGTFTITDQGVMDEVVEAALACGYRHFDTAAWYKNEHQLGTSLKKFLPKFGLKRADIFITTKMHPRTEEASSVADRLKLSLSGLQTDYVDLLLIHYPKHRTREDDDPRNPGYRKSTWLAFEKISQSRVRSIGVSNYEIYHLQQMKAYATKLPAVNQLEFHPHFTRAPLRRYCDEHGIYFQAFSSLGRHNPALVQEPLLAQLAKKHRTTVELILLAYGTSQSVGVIPKSTHAERVAENFACLNVKLSAAEIAQLDALNRDASYIETTGWLVK